MSRLRIGLDYRPALLASAGIARAVRELARALAARADLEVHLLGHMLSAARRRDSLPPGARLHRLRIPGRGLPLLAKLGLDAAALCGRPAVFHWTDYVHPEVSRAPVVLTLHDVAFAEDPRFHGTGSAALHARTVAAVARAARVVVPTQATAASAERLLGVPAAKLRVVPFGADHVPMDPRPDPPLPRPYLLTIGTIEPRKGHLTLLRAFELLPEPRPELVVLGRRGWECAAIVAALAEAARRGTLRWIEDADDATAFWWLAHAAALVYPSELEGFGFPPLEAMALGTPVVASDIPALRETLGAAALRCAPADPRALAQAIDEVLHSRARRHALRAAGRERVADLTWARCAESYAQVYHEAAGS